MDVSGWGVVADTAGAKSLSCPPHPVNTWWSNCQGRHVTLPMGILRPLVPALPWV